MNHSLFDFLATRRSVKPDKLSGPGPTAAELTSILTAGTRVPDHKKLAPWRFIVFEGAARARIGEIFADACQREEKEPPSPVRLDLERNRFLRAPLVIAAVSQIKHCAVARKPRDRIVTVTPAPSFTLYFTTVGSPTATLPATSPVPASVFPGSVAGMPPARTPS